MPHVGRYHRQAAGSIREFAGPADRCHSKRGAQTDRAGDRGGAGHAAERLRRPQARGRPCQAGAPRSSAGAGHPDRDRPRCREGAARTDRTPGADKITFTPSILPRYLRKAKSVEELLPWLYLQGVSTGDFSGEAPNAIRPRERAEPGRPAGAGRQGPVGQDHHAAEGGLVDGLSGLGEARPRHAPVSRSPDHSDGSRSRAHSGPTAPTSSHEWLMK
jgi:hypothetical protein